jgi:hypothetical protein
MHSAREGVLANSEPTIKTPCSPTSQISGALLPVATEQQRSWPSERTTSNRRHLTMSQQSRRILEWLIATGLAISK